MIQESDNRLGEKGEEEWHAERRKAGREEIKKVIFFFFFFKQKTAYEITV